MITAHDSSSTISKPLITRAAVVVPALEDFYFTARRFSALGALVVCQILEKTAIKASLHLFPPRAQTRIALPSCLGHLQSFIIPDEIGRSSYFTHYQRFGPSDVQSVDEVLADDPHIVLVSCFAWCYSKGVLDFCTELKTRRPDIPIICGGAGVSAYPEYFIRRSCIDFVVEGEAEVSLPRFLMEVQKPIPRYMGIPNLWWKRGEEVNKPQSVCRTRGEEIVVPFASLYVSRRYVSLSTSLSRGCSRDCRFCSGALVHGRGYRHADVDNVLNSVLIIKGTLQDGCGPVHLNLEDDNPLLDPEFFLKMLDLLRNEFGTIELSAENGLDYRTLTFEITNMLIDSGMRRFSLSLGSASAVALDKERRRLDLDHFESLISLLTARGISSTTFFIAGLESDSRTTVAQTLSYLYGKRTFSGISLFYPVPGLAQFRDPGCFDAIDPILCAGSAAWPWMGSLDTATMITAFRISRFINLCKSGNCTDVEQEVVNRTFGSRKLHFVRKSGNKGIEILPVPGMDQELMELFFGRV